MSLFLFRCNGDAINANVLNGDLNLNALSGRSVHSEMSRTYSIKSTSTQHEPFFALQEYLDYFHVVGVCDHDLYTKGHILLSLAVSM